MCRAPTVSMVSPALVQAGADELLDGKSASKRRLRVGVVRAQDSAASSGARHTERQSCLALTCVPIRSKRGLRCVGRANAGQAPGSWAPLWVRVTGDWSGVRRCGETNVVSSADSWCVHRLRLRRRDSIGHASTVWSSRWLCKVYNRQCRGCDGSVRVRANPDGVRIDPGSGCGRAWSHMEPVSPERNASKIDAPHCEGRA